MAAPRAQGEDTRAGAPAVGADLVPELARHGADGGELAGGHGVPRAGAAQERGEGAVVVGRQAEIQEGAELGTRRSRQTWRRQRGGRMASGGGGGW